MRAATQAKTRTVIQFPDRHRPELVYSECHDCGQLIMDKRERVFCENCIAIDDMRHFA